MAKNRGKEAFFQDDSFNVEEREVQEVQEHSTRSTGSTRGNVQEVQEVQEIEFGSTQGRKGQKAPRINMAFHPEVHTWIKTRSKQLGISATEFVNRILYNEMLKGE